MQRDFHYCCIAVLARAAGYRQRDALKIAYASQYVDDAVESEMISVGGIPFEPTRTAHYGLKSFSWGTQKRVFLPFHFLPGKPLTGVGDTFRTLPDSEFAHMVWDEAVAEPDPPFRHIRMGVALHTFADTWAHQQFTGREAPENDVEAIRHRRNGRMKRLVLPNFYLDFAPKIGHAQAGTYPDQPWLVWDYEAPHSSAPGGGMTWERKR